MKSLTVTAEYRVAPFKNDGTDKYKTHELRLTERDLLWWAQCALASKFPERSLSVDKVVVDKIEF